jgi:2'-5' RNA ligase
VTSQPSTLRCSPLPAPPSSTLPAPPSRRLRDHWQWRPDWSVERACLLWYLTFEDAPTLSAQAEQAHARLRGMDSLDVVPLRWLHLTLDDVGFADELHPAQAEDVVRAAQAAVAGWVPPPLTLGPLDAMEDSVVLRAGPAEELADLHQRLRSATASVPGAAAVSGLDDFWPHVTLAYLNRECDPEEVMAPLSAEPATQLVLAIPRLTLAAVTRRDRHYQWTACAQLPLGG